MKNYYDILSISEKSDSFEIKKAYRKAVNFWHPDKNNSPIAKEKILEIIEAYEVLGNTKRKEMYDNLYFKKETQTNNPKYSKKEEKDFYNWLKELQSKISIKKADNILTESFHLIDKYGCLIILLFFACFILIALVLK
jgi:DnaJ-class molecular chaperone